MANHFELLNVELSSSPIVISFGGGFAEYSFSLFDTFYGPELTVATSGTAAIASAGGPVELASGAIVDSGESYSAYPSPEPIPYSPGWKSSGWLIRSLTACIMAMRSCPARRSSAIVPTSSPQRRSPQVSSILALNPGSPFIKMTCSATLCWSSTPIQARL